MGNIGDHVEYDPVKSDVWSLGLTLLYMITNKNVKELANTANLEANIRKRINSINNPLFKGLLEKMITINPNERANFITLEAIFSQEVNEKKRILAVIPKITEKDIYYEKSPDQNPYYNDINNIKNQFIIPEENYQQRIPPYNKE